MLYHLNNIIKSLMNNIGSSVKDFTLLSVIGKGTYAKVLLVRSKKDNQVYAMKSLKKKYIIQKNQCENIMTQKNILTHINHPFLVKLYASFQDQKKLYFILEYCPGGQLFGLLSLKDKLSEEQTKFYAAQIILAIEVLHNHNIIYRDLKPQNVLLDKSGYLKLTDFGLSKAIGQNQQSTMSVCGTPQYLAPQVIKKEGHGKPVDWWCLGCIIYQMLTGYPPFRNQNRLGLFQEILYKPVDAPKVSPKLQSLVSLLLQKDPKTRIGKNGSAQIKAHPWFEKVNWNALSNKSIKAPFVPILSSDDDFSNFDEQFTTRSINSYSENKSQMDEESIQFVGFNFG